MHIEQINVADLREYERNSRTHDKKQIQAIANSIKEFGFTNPLLLRDDNTIIAGHGRLAAARLLGLEQVPCIRLSHLAPEQARAYVIADNALAEQAGWDMEMLKIEILKLQELDFDLGLTGFDLDSLAGLTTEIIGDTSTDRKGQGVSSTWNQVKSGEMAKVVLGKLETRLPVEVVGRLSDHLNREYELHGTPVNLSLQKFVEVALENSGH
jgi:hypothetical protein